MRTFPQVAVILLCGVVAGCGRAERSPPVELGKVEAARRDAPQSSAPARATPERRLAATPGTVLEANLTGSQAQDGSRIHSYRIDLAAGQYADLTVDQRG